MQIFYTGVGAHPRGIHSVPEFIHIMKKEFGPIRRTLYEWIEFSGAEIVL
jgi:hypothetical protein